MTPPVPRELKAHTVYRFYDAEGVLLYVGLTVQQGSQRLQEHQKVSAWWPQVAACTFEHVPDRATAYKVEEEAILRERPLFNQRARGMSPKEVAEARDRVLSLVANPPVNDEATA